MYKIEISTAETGSVIRIVSEQTGKHICIGGFEGMQRNYTARKIRASKASLVCLNNKWEVVSHLSSYLTKTMHKEKIETVWMGGNEVLNAVDTLCTAVGRCLFYSQVKGTYKKEGITVKREETVGLSVYIVNMEPKKPSFDVKKAVQDGIVEKKQIAALFKEGWVSIDGEIFYQGHYLLPAQTYPFVVVITIITSGFSKIEVLNILLPLADQKVKIILRVAPEVYLEEKTKYMELEILANLTKVVTRALNIYAQIYIVVDKDNIPDSFVSFYKMAADIDPCILFPKIHVPAFTRYLKKYITLTEGSILDIFSEMPVKIKSNNNDTSSEIYNNTNVYNNINTEERIKNNNIQSLKKKNISKTDNNIRNNNIHNIQESSHSLLFLGTGAAVPTQLRNVSSTLLSSPISSILLDCGEDTTTQLSRISYNRKYPFQHISAVVLSHHHADHILGTLSLINRANRNNHTSILVIGEPSLCPALKCFSLSCIFVDITKVSSLDIYRDSTSYLETMTDIVKISFFAETVFLSIVKTKSIKQTHPSFFTSKHLLSPSKLISVIYTESKIGSLQMINIEKSLSLPEVNTSYLSNLSLVHSLTFCPAKHIEASQSIRVDSYYNGKDFSVSYTGDTLPNKDFSYLSYEADVMIHEATFLDEDIINASSTKHSTVSQALSIYQASKAKYLFLTHISQRYKNVPILSPALLAFDFLLYHSNTLYTQTELLAAVAKWHKDKE